ncbi:FAD-dependent oxidoreductase [Actinokineospora enzanensis]|uniref:FAD-dependent oxidoreductase n=1 Tax=Actinokineospora enzanensis TaxID=155975 RepID=UPI0012ECA39B|nr:FAD-dependent oxidoreductase [Actinokineospora enzanensis]
MPFDAVVLGSGVAGLSTAIRLAEAGATVLIRTAAEPAETTSALASAMIGPNLYPPGDEQRDWADETLRVLTSSDFPGVVERTGLLVARPANATPPFVERTPGYAPCAELPAGFGTGFHVRLPIVDMPVYLAGLRQRFLDLGGKVELNPVGSLAEAAGLAPRVANCTGLAAASLVDDPELRPVRGPKIVVENPGLDTFFLEAPIGAVWAAILPHGDHVVLGGTSSDSADTTPDPAEEAEILRRCAEVEPRLAGARVLEHKVGLRPGRPRPRVEAERVGGALVAHNYGHAGNGVMFSWGCAAAAAALLAD